MGVLIIKLLVPIIITAIGAGLFFLYHFLPALALSLARKLVG